MMALLKPSLPKQPNPYVIAIFTAVLAGAFSVLGTYFTAQFQAKHAIAQKQLEYRAQSYAAFLEKIDRSRSPEIGQLLSIGSLAERVTTDSEIQNLEDQLAVLLRKAPIQDLYWKLNSDLNLVRLHGSIRVRRVCDDILKALALREFEIDWSGYPRDVSQLREKWAEVQKEGATYGWQPRISNDKRLMIIVVGKLFELLVTELRNELQTPAST